MKTAIVPAQVTTVEDTIAGNLTLSQIILVVVPVFLSTIIFAVFPPHLKVDVYKLCLAIVLSMPPLILSIRIHGQIILRRVMLGMSFLYKPKLYLHTAYSERCACQEYESESTDHSEVFALDKEVPTQELLSSLSYQELSEIESFLSSKKLNFYSNKEGKINAVIEP